MSNEPDDAIDDVAETKTGAWRSWYEMIPLAIVWGLGICIGAMMNGAYCEWYKSDNGVRVISRDCQGAPIAETVRPPGPVSTRRMNSVPEPFDLPVAKVDVPPFILATIAVEIEDSLPVDQMAASAKKLSERFRCWLKATYRGKTFHVGGMDTESEIAQRWVRMVEKAASEANAGQP